MSGKISGLVLLAVALAAMLAGAQVVALVACVVGALFLLYSSGVGGGSRRSLRDSGGLWVDGGSSVGSDSNQCDAGDSSADCGGGDGGSGGGD